MPVPVITVSQMREWEKATWATGKNETEVISRVGEIVARRIHELVGKGGLVLILAGKGHNGDDALAAKDHLTDLRVEVCPVTDPAAAIPEITRFLEQRPALIVDGLFGIGINRPLDKEWQRLIKLINESQIPVLAVDVPSGLNADTGEPSGAAIRASVTLTLAAPKKGMLLSPAWPYIGRLEVAPDIGLVKCPHTGEMNWTLPEDFAHFPPPRPAAAHKGDFGRLAIVAGSLGFHGAAVLTSRGAQRAHPGLITLHTPAPVYPVVASQLQAAVMVSPWQPTLRLPGDYDAVLIGPGLAAPDLPNAIKQSVSQLWEESPVPLVVDASALDWIPAGPMSGELIRVITPHPGEAARLLRMPPREIQENRPGSLARNLPPARQFLGRFERRANLDRPQRWRNICQFLRQSAPRPGRQRGSPRRFSRRLAGAVRPASGPAPNHPLWRLGTRRGGGPLEPGQEKLDRRGFGR